MADNKNMVKFGRGSKSMEDFKLVTGYENMVYFNTSTYEIYVGEKKYGFSDADRALLNSAIDSISYNETNATFTVSYVDSSKDDVTFSIPTADTKTPGLMTSAQVTALGEAAAAVLRLEGYTDSEGTHHKGSVETAQAAAEAYALGLVEALDLEEVKSEGQAIVSISQVDGKVSAVAGDVAASHVSVADADEKFVGTNVEAVLAEIAGKIESLDSSAEAVDGKISTAINNLDSDVKDESKAHVKIAISQVDGKLSSVTVTEDNIADKSVVDGLVTSVGASTDTAKVDGSVYARIAALVAEDSNLDSRLDVIEGEGAGSVKKAEADAKAYADGLVADLDANVSSVAGQKLTVNVVEVDGKVTEVNVTDHDIASAATLASLKEDVELFFKDASFAADAKDTLKELQEYITSDVAGAASMAESIAANKTAIEQEVEARQAAISGLNSEKASENGSFVNVTVKQEAGVITSVSVSEDDIASAAELDALEALVGTAADGKDAATAFGKIAAEADARTQAVNTINGRIDSVEDAVEDAQANAEKYADDAVKALKEGEVAANAAAIAQEIEDRKAGDEATLNAAKAYTEEALYWYEG